MYRKRPLSIPLTKRVRPVLRTVLLAAAMTGLAGCSLLPAEKELQPPLIQPAEDKYEVVKAATGDIQTALTGMGTFVSDKVESLAFKESGGRIKAMTVKLGDQVKAGDLLAELETGDLELQLKLQRLSVERVELLERQAREAGANATDLRLRRIDLERERLVLDSMEKRFASARLYSPISGTVIFVQALNPGDGVAAYQAIVTVADPSSMHLTYTVADAKELIAVEAGMPVDLTYKGKAYKGKVLQAPANVPSTADKSQADRNAMTLYMSMENKPADVQVGDVADIRIELQKRSKVIVLPRGAIRSYMDRYYVQIMEGDYRKEADIEVGLMTPTQVEIVRGVEEGQQVILNQ